MPVIAAFLYRDGVRLRQVELDGRDVEAPGPNDFVWIGLFEPTPDELEELRLRYDLHPLAIEDAHKANQLPKVEVYGDQLFVIARTAQLGENGIEYGETSIFVGRGHIITVRHGSARAHTALRAQLEAASALLSHGVDYVLHGVLDFIVDGYLPVVEAIEEEVLAMEQKAVESFLSREQVTRIFQLRRELTQFQRILGPMSEVCNKLVRLDLPCIDAEARPYFRDVLDHVQRVTGSAAALRDVLKSVFEVSTLFEQQRQSLITRQLAAWAAILAVPTAIAGIYGMNFANMPELRTTYGYFVVMGVIAALCALLFVRFKKAGWL